MCESCDDTLVREWTDAELDLADQITTALMCKALAVDGYAELALAEQRLRKAQAQAEPINSTADRT